jgi:hypothetical protein
MKLSELVLSNDPVSSSILGSYKVTRTHGPCTMYNTHARDVSGDIFVDSIQADWLNHTKDYKVIMSDKYTKDEKIENSKYICNYIKTKTILGNPSCCWLYSELSTDVKNKRTLSTPIFFCNYSNVTFGHTAVYFFPQVYIYLELKKYIPNLMFVMPHHRNYELESYLLNLIDAGNYITITESSSIRNLGVTFFAGAWSLNYDSAIIDGFFQDVVVRRTLLKYPQDVSTYPKKLLFLRNSENATSGRIIKNRAEICELCSKYGYVDVDQTKFSINQVIHLVNNATHLIQEAGGSTTHLLWAKKIKSIVLHYSSREYYHSYVTHAEDSDPYLRFISDNMLSDITRSKGSKLIFNDMVYVRTGVPSITDEYTFLKLDELEAAIKVNEIEHN